MVAFVRVNLVGMLVYLFSNYIALSYIHENKEGSFHYTIVVVYTVLNQFDEVSAILLSFEFKYKCCNFH